MKKIILLYPAAILLFLLPLFFFHKDLLGGLKGKNLFSLRFHDPRNTEKATLSGSAAAPEHREKVSSGTEKNIQKKEEIFPNSPHENMRRTFLVRAIEKTLPAVVNIGTERLTSRRYFSVSDDPIQQLFDDFLRTQENAKSFSLGSGFLIHPAGLIVTNAHVIDRTAKIHVTLSDGTTGEGKIIASDIKSDVALLLLY